MLYRRCHTSLRYFTFEIFVIYVTAIIMFVIKQWGKKFTMNRNNEERQIEKKNRVPRSMINLAFEPDNVLAALNVDVPTSVVDKKTFPINNNRNSLEIKSLISPKDEDLESCESSINCKCRNCRALPNLTECGVCFESLQSNHIKACPVCANVVCTRCASRLASCAYCRSDQPPERNRALERLVDKLVLPCRNLRSGCKTLLNGENRFIHESMCNFSPISCPVGRKTCLWRGPVASVRSHLHSAHNLHLLRDHGISIEIHNFRNKARASDGRVYTVCLSCYEQLFIIRVVLYQGRLILCSTRLGRETLQSLNDRPEHFGISVTVRAQMGRRIRGYASFGKYDRESREIVVTCDELYPDNCPNCHRKNNIVDDKSCNDLVKIDLVINKLEDTSTDQIAN